MKKNKVQAKTSIKEGTFDKLSSLINKVVKRPINSS